MYVDSGPLYNLNLSTHVAAMEHEGMLTSCLGIHWSVTVNNHHWHHVNHILWNKETCDVLQGMI
jgi:hypothetical protein